MQDKVPESKVDDPLQYQLSLIPTFRQFDESTALSQGVQACVQWISLGAYREPVSTNRQADSVPLDPGLD
jgi:hypothetical protein